MWQPQKHGTFNWKTLLTDVNVGNERRWEAYNEDEEKFKKNRSTSVGGEGL